MEFNQSEWLGYWVNFESYIYNEETAMKQCWAEAETFAKALPMFQHGVKAFWQMACTTINEENPVHLGGWKIETTEKDDEMTIQWLDEAGTSLGTYRYRFATIIPKGLEAKENYLFEAVDAPENCPFHYLLAMRPMPERTAKNNGGLLSHLHFQYASRIENLLQDGKLCKPMWYATMCDGEGDLLARCNIVRALHHLPTWENL